MSAFVFVVESGDYENHSIDGVYSTVDLAIAAIKARYSSPDIVVWSEPEPIRDNENIVLLRGKFLRNRIVWETEFEITRYEIDA